MKQKLPKRFKDKWVKALLSGKYEQGIGSLRGFKSNRYCCLGVACEIVGAVPKWQGFIDEDITGYEKIPKILHGYKEIPNALAALNDAGVPFEMIAGFINENL